MAFLAEREGLEPSHQVTPAYKFSKLAPSPTWVPLHIKEWSRRWGTIPQPIAYKAIALPLCYVGIYKATFLNQLSKIADVCDVCCQSPLCNWWRIWVTIPSELLLARQTTTPCSPIPHISKPPGSRLSRFPTVHLVVRHQGDLRSICDSCTPVGLLQ